MFDVVFVPIICMLIVLWAIAIGGIKETDGASLLLLFIVIPASIITGLWIKNYNNVPWEYQSPRYVQIEKRGDQYIAIDLEENKVYNVLEMIGRIPKENEVVEIKKQDKSKQYYNIQPTGLSRNKVDVVEKK